MLHEQAIERERHAAVQRELRAAQPTVVYHTPFITYQQLNGKKSSGGTLHDLWTRMLLCIRGLSAEKVVEITQRWPTPQALIAAFEQCERDNGSSETLISRTVDAVTPLSRRRIGHTNSAYIWQVLRSHEYPG